MITLILKHRFIVGPVLLSSLTRHFDGIEHLFRFYELVQDYLPEEKEKMLEMAPVDAGNYFVKQFSKRYFPIKASEGVGLVYEDGNFIKHTLIRNIIRSIPVEWHGLITWRYEPGFGFEPLRAQLLAEVICEPPFDGANRIPVVAEFKKRLGDELADITKLIPENGYSLAEVKEALKDSEYPGFLTWCRWIFSMTGNRWLDTTSAHGEIAGWDRETVQELARQWPEYLELDREMSAFNKWLKQDFGPRSAQIIKSIAHWNKSRLINVLGGKDAVS